jgi:Flp pilus assembly protein protease CpaA
MSGGDSTASALTSGYQLAFAVGAGLVILAIVLATLLLRSPEEAVAVETAEAETALAQEEAA